MGKSLIRVAMFLGTLALGIATAAAGIAPMLPGMHGTVPSSGRPVVIVGQLQSGDYALFLEVVNSVKPDIIVLDSPGGLLDEGLLIAAEIRRRGLNTFVYGNTACASACAVIFLSGRTKYARPNAEIGLHASFYGDGTPSVEGTAVMAYYLSEIGAPLSLVSRMSATPPWDMYWLTEEDKRDLDIRESNRGAQKVRR